ncbi:ubiquitin fusion degradation protein UFD1-domain-containing protein [Xylaria nigripes]|nr:ubiquitin fusion degradation protein UFD1-domain-containing protein [Xylaria nigripes]
MNEQSVLRWSATFTAFLPPVGLKGDKIILPQSALEQLLAASNGLSNATATTVSSFSAFERQNSRVDSQQLLPTPLIFRLVNQANGNAVYAGIREFSAQEDEVLLSPYLMEALGISTDQLTPRRINHPFPDTDDSSNEGFVFPKITVHAKELPKGSYVRLRPLEAGYNPDDWKALLERQLRESFTTLTNGAFLSVRGVKGEIFRFLVDRFRPQGEGICVVDTDLEVDIEALNEEQARETMRQVIAKAQPASGAAGGSSVGQELNIWKAVDGQVLPGDYVDYELPSWARSRALEIEISQLDNEHDVDLYVSPKSSRQRVPPRESEYVFGAFAFPEGESGVKRITISPTNSELDDAEAILISVHGYNSQSLPVKNLPRPFRVRARNITASQDDATHSASQEKTEEHGSDEEQCGNCTQWVPKRTMVLHESFCRRNNVACPQCHNVFQKSSTEWKQHWHCPHDVSKGSSEMSKLKHDYLCHSQHSCPGCTFTTNSLADLARHRTTLCPDKIILCKFCHLEVPQEGDPFNPSPESLLSGLSEHELADGARTTDCHLCSKIIRLRDMATHLKHHELEKAHRPKPDICRNANCGRTLRGVGRNGTVGIETHMGQGSGNDIGLCTLCFSPLYVSLHDPEGKALKRRIERRYLSQLITGCRKAWCQNEWCKTGRQNAHLEAKGSTAQAILPQIKPLVDTFRDTQTPMRFCVDENNQQRRALAELLAREKVWDLEWCVAACEAEGPDPEKAHEWLMNWAPMKE